MKMYFTMPSSSFKFEDWNVPPCPFPPQIGASLTVHHLITNYFSQACLLSKVRAVRHLVATALESNFNQIATHNEPMRFQHC